MTSPLMITMTIILTFEYYGRIIKLNIYDTMLNDIYYFEVTYQSNQFAHPIQDCRDILHCCKYLYYYNQHCLYMKILWKKESQLRSGILVDRINVLTSRRYLLIRGCILISSEILLLFLSDIILINQILRGQYQSNKLNKEYSKRPKNI